MKHTKKKALLLGAAGLLLGATVAYASSVSVEYDTNRYGSDYAGMELPSADPELCRTACAEDPNCRAYTYVKPGIQGSSARCWLKDSVPAATANSCCVSGVKDDTQPPPTTLTVEPGMNRYGSDYKGLDLPAADPELCRTECANDSHCLAYTYVKPGVQGTYAKCWLKNPAPAATPDPNTVSGIKQ
ncbi:PAN domain-containing protein [Archangium violaceum]|uniref:PAN domain-containing protein n=1 Tax=Archangium violaceum TaxID=83451 RepID=UPI0037BE8479